MSIIHRETAAELSAAALRSLILSRELAPGSRITEIAMAEYIGVSRATMRQSLNTLLMEGLLTRHPTTRVLQVTTLSRDDIIEVYRARRVLEFAGVDASANAQPEQLQQLRMAVDDMATALAGEDVAGFVTADSRCHALTVGFLGSTLLSETHATLMMKLRLAITQAETADSARRKIELTQHREFFSYIEARQIAKARTNLERRLNDAEQLMLDDLSSSEPA